VFRLSASFSCGFATDGRYEDRQAPEEENPAGNERFCSPGDDKAGDSNSVAAVSRASATNMPRSSWQMSPMMLIDAPPPPPPAAGAPTT
jgi:hypothetical protein